MNNPEFDAGSSNGVGHSFKRAFYTILPDAAVDTMLLLWRKYYWWQKLRTRPRRNLRVVREIVRNGAPIKLELGSWKREGMEDWIASDIGGGGDLQLDLTQPIPFPDNSVEIIYSSHLLEHFSYPKPMLDLLRECHRILKPGGTISIAVPNARIFLDAYASARKLDREKYCSYDVGLSYKTKIDYVNFIAYMGGDHKHMFDEENLLLILEESGFREVHLREFDMTLDLQIRRHESIYAEGVK